MQQEDSSGQVPETATPRPSTNGDGLADPKGQRMAASICVSAAMAGRLARAAREIRGLGADVTAVSHNKGTGLCVVEMTFNTAFPEALLYLGVMAGKGS